MGAGLSGCIPWCVCLSGGCLNGSLCAIMGVSTENSARTHLLIYFWKEGVPIMGTVKDSHSLICEPSIVRWCGGSRLFTERFASATGKVASRRAGNGAKGQAGGSADSPAPFVKTWVLTGSLGSGSVRVEEG